MSKIAAAIIALVAIIAPLRSAIGQAANITPEMYRKSVEEFVATYAEVVVFYRSLRDDVCSAQSDKVYGRRSAPQRTQCQADFDNLILLKRSDVVSSIEAIIAKQYNDPREPELRAKAKRDSEIASAKDDQVNCLHMQTKDKKDEKCKKAAKP